MNPTRRIPILASILLAAVAISATTAAQTSSVWTPLRYFEGTWKGAGEGIGGKSTIDRAFRFVLDGNFLHFTTKAVFPPQEKNPKGAVHQDWGMISFDRVGKKFVLREFHTEKYVNTYALEIAEDGRTLVFTSERIENMPEGWRARLTLKIEDANTFEERFELAPPDQDYLTCSTNKFTRRVTTAE